jgi:MFS family permease
MSMWLINPTFARYWFSHFSSSFSNALTGFLIPLIGVSILGASAFEMGVLVAIQESPVILFSLIVGLWIDRINLRRALIVALSIQAVVVAIMGALLFSRWRSMEVLYLTAALIGSVRLVIDLAGTTYIPALVKREQLVGANSRLQISLATERVLGPAVGGLIARATPFLGFALAAVGHFLAAIFIAQVRPKEVRPDEMPSDQAAKAIVRRMSWHADIRSGIRLLFEIRMLRPVILSSCLGSVAVGMFYALLVYSLVERLHLSEINAGILVSVIGTATLVVAVVVPRLTHLIGAGWAMICGVMASAFGFGTFAYAIYTNNVVYAASALLMVGAGTALFSINQISVRQAVTPAEVLGRVNASRRFVVFAFLPIGSLFGGAVAEFSSVATSLWIASGVMFVSALPLLLSPVKGYRLTSY